MRSPRRSAASGRQLVGRVVGHDRSGDKLDDFENSVSHTGIAFFESAPVAPQPRPLSGPEQEYLLQLARRTVKALVRHQPLPADTPPLGAGPDSVSRPTAGFSG